MTADDECDLTTLPASMCACPHHRGGTAPGEDIETVGQPFEAAYPGVCARCDGQIEPGQTIARTWDGPDYVHVARCPR